jgi:hypothetical protein
MHYFPFFALRGVPPADFSTNGWPLYEVAIGNLGFRHIAASWWMYGRLPYFFGGCRLVPLLPLPPPEPSRRGVPPQEP